MPASEARRRPTDDEDDASHATREGKRRGIQLGVGLVLATILIYLPALRGGFIWNDSDYVTATALRTWSGLWRIWFEVGATEQYYPLLHTAFWVEQLLWGDIPAGYHAVNIALHAANALLLVALLRRLRISGAWLAGYLFALHPVGVESVAWIAEQKNTLSTCFGLLAMLAYQRFEVRRNAASYALATALFVAALLTKSLTATLTGALLVITWWQRGRIEWRRDVVPLLPWIVAGAAAGLFTGWVERKVLYAEGPDFDLTLLQRLLVAGRAAWFYLGKLVWPAELIFIYPRWSIDVHVAWQYLYPILLLAVLAALWVVRRHSRAPLAVLLLFLGTLFPVSGLFNVYGFLFSYVADHWQYLPSIAVLTFIAAALTRGAQWLAPGVRQAAPLGAAALLVVLGSLSFRQSGLYRDIVSFYERTIAANPGCWMAYNNLGIIRAHENDWAQAIRYYEESLRLKPTRPETHTNLGVAYARSGRWEDAARHLSEALRLNPKMQVAADALGTVLHHYGRHAEAVALHERAIQLKPDYAEAYTNLTAALLDLNQTDRARQAATRALQLNAASPEAHNNMGILLARLGQTDRAIAHYREALRLRPDFAPPHDNLGAALAATGRLDEAVAEYQSTLRLQGDTPTTLNNLGNALRGLRRYDESIEALKRAVNLSPTHPVIQYNLALALNEAGRQQEAKPYYRFARQQAPQAPVVPSLETEP